MILLEPSSKAILQERKERTSTKQRDRLCCATFHKRPLAPPGDAEPSIEGRDRGIGAILHEANSMVALGNKGDTFQEKG